MQGVQKTATPTPTTAPTPSAAPALQPVVEVTPAPAIENSQLAEMLLRVVSEKVCYPAVMLELSMDMEADLGIDSIKRVEIFGALTQKYRSEERREGKECRSRWSPDH